MNTENPLWIGSSGDSESIYDNSNVDASTSEKPCVAGFPSTREPCPLFICTSSTRFRGI